MGQRGCCIAVVLMACGGSGAHDTPPPDPMGDAPVDQGSLPEGACRSTADCSLTKFCDWTPPPGACGANDAIGTCAPLGPPLCPDLGYWVCGCDGHTYINECHSAGIGVAVDYGGPCRPSGAHVACQVSDDCPFDAEFPQYCVDDPTDDCDPASGACPGICVHGTYVCSPTLPCLSQTQSGIQESPDTEACMTVTPGSNPDGNPGRCIYTTRQKCTSPADCGTGELCMPELGCDPKTTSCPSDCVRP
jgi:hypothetical protein